MDYEKKYKEANDKVAVRFGTNVAKEIFTDLYESEDERIKKSLIEFVKQSSEVLDKQNQNNMIDWLEKQGEQKPMTEEFEHELAEICNQLLSEIDSEWMNNEILDCIGTSVWLNLCDETAKRYKDGLLKLAKQGEQKPAEWGEEDETTFKVMLEELEKYVMFKQYSTPLSVYDLQWFKSLKDRIQPQPKQEWSVEDETGWTNTMIMIKEVASNHYTKDSIKLVMDWLKSLKQRIGG